MITGNYKNARLLRHSAIIYHHTHDIKFHYSCETILFGGRSGLAVACLTAVREVLGSSRTAVSCVYRKSHCDLQPWARPVCTLPAEPRSTQPSILRGTVNEYQLSG